MIIIIITFSKVNFRTQIFPKICGQFLGSPHDVLDYCYITRYMDMWNRHRESKNTKLYEIGSGTKLLFTFLSLKVFRHEERETQSFYADCFYIVSSQPNQCAAPLAHKVVWPRPALKVNLLPPKQELNSAFSQIWFWCVTSPKYPGPNWMTHPLCVCVNTCVNVAPN